MQEIVISSFDIYTREKVADLEKEVQTSLENFARSEIKAFKKKYHNKPHILSCMSNLKSLKALRHWPKDIQREVTETWAFQVDFSKKPSFAKVYILQDSLNQVLKIGVSKDVGARLKQLQGSAGRFMSIVFESELIPRKSCQKIEKEFMNRFNSHRLAGEYFSYDCLGFDTFMNKIKLFCQHYQDFQED